jgi:hypothetical protein
MINLNWADHLRMEAKSDTESNPTAHQFNSYVSFRTRFGDPDLETKKPEAVDHKRGKKKAEAHPKLGSEYHEQYF